MNTETTATTPEPNSASNIQSVDFTTETKQIHRKIAKLPKALRDLINTSLDDGLPAREIVEKLQASTNPPLPYPITEVNISRWKSTGYQRYIAHQEHLDYVDASREAALEMVATSDKMTLPEATLQVIASQCFEVLADFSPAAIKQKLAADPLKYTSFLHVFARLTREIVHLEKYRDAKAKAAAEKAAAESKPTPSDHARLFAQTDAFLMNSPGKWPTLNKPVAGQTPPAQPRPEPPPTQPLAKESQPPPAPEPPPTLAKSEPPKADTAAILTERCLDCRATLPPLTPEGNRPEETCHQCGVRLPAPGLCTYRSNDPCHRCGAILPARLPDGNRPKPVCHNCGVHLGRD